MIYELYRVLNVIAIVLVCLVISAFQSVLLKMPSLHWLELDMLLLVVVYISLHRGFFEGTFLVCLIGRLAEVHSAAPAGIILSCYLAVFLAILFTKEVFLVGTSFSSIILAMAGGLICKITFFVLAQRYGILGNTWRASLEYMFPYLISAGFFSRLVFDGLRRLDYITKVDIDTEARNLSGEEF